MPRLTTSEVRERLAAWVWGWDTGAKRGGLGCIELATGRFASYAAEWRPEREKGGAMPLSPSLKLAYQHTYDLASAVLHRYPLTVAVELASGKPNPSLMFHGGVQILALEAATGLAPWLINVSTWKRVTGMGAKSDLLPWIAGLGYPIDDEDQAAGVAIAAGAAVEMYGFDLSKLHPVTQPARRAA